MAPVTVADDAVVAQAVRAAIQEARCNGKRPLMVAVVLDDHSLYPVRLPLETIAPDGRQPIALGRCAQDILDTLRDVGHRLTTTRLLEEMARHGLEWSDRTVKRHLGDLIDVGRLDNRQDTNPPGYGIPE